MIIWSVAYYVGRSCREQRSWFASEPEAMEWMRTQSFRGLTGPFQHRIEGKRGLLSVLHQYAS